MRFDNSSTGLMLRKLWQNLPVFVVKGGSREARRTFMHWIVAHCCEYNILAVVDDGSFPLVEAAYLAKRADLVLLDETRSTAFPAVHWIKLCEDTGEVSVEEGGIFCPWPLENGKSPDSGSTGAGSFWPILLARLDELVRAVPVWGCILIGGKSSRMGRPKHLLQDQDGRTWLERTVRMLSPVVDGFVVSGAGELPHSVAQIQRLIDIPGVVGPLNGILAATRWQPQVSWLILACDMPHVSEAAVSWLLSQRKAGCWGVVPQLAGTARFEPLFAWYDIRSSHLFEEQLFSGNMRIGEMAGHEKINNPLVPEILAQAWRNINTPAQLSEVSPTTGV